MHNPTPMAILSQSEPPAVDAAARALPIPATRAEVLHEIEFLERRLRAIGDDGDCSYERALARTYRLLIEQRRRRLGHDI